jgi:fructose-specific phosphotransferase system IIC component
MNKLALQLFLVLAFIPIFVVIGGLIILLAPLYCSGLAINAYRLGNTKELYFWLAIGVVAFFLALSILGVR